MKIESQPKLNSIKELDALRESLVKKLNPDKPCITICTGNRLPRLRMYGCV